MPQKVIEELRRALEIDPENPDVTRMLEEEIEEERLDNWLDKGKLFHCRTPRTQAV